MRDIVEIFTSAWTWLFQGFFPACAVTWAQRGEKSLLMANPALMLVRDRCLIAMFHCLIFPQMLQEKTWQVKRLTSPCYFFFFFLPRLKCDVSRYVKSCQICQVTDKSGQGIKAAPLNPIVRRPFEHLIIDRGILQPFPCAPFQWNPLVRPWLSLSPPLVSHMWFRVIRNPTSHMFKQDREHWSGFIKSQRAYCRLESFLNQCLYK